MDPNFTICIPAFNSLPYLKLLIKGLKENSVFKHDIIIHDNGSEDGTREWLIKNKINYTYSDENLGFCGVNYALKKAPIGDGLHTMIFNSDMVPLSNWDMALVQYQKRNFQSKKIKKYTLSSCLVEPNGFNHEYDIFDAGQDYHSFDSEKIKKELSNNRSKYITRPSTIQYSHPIMMPSEMLRDIDYMDIDYFPGWSSDHDLAARAYKVGCRDFVMVGSSRVYHFSSKTFKQLPDHVRAMHGQDIFEKKWGKSVEEFRKELKITQKI